MLLISQIFDLAKDRKNCKKVNVFLNSGHCSRIYIVLYIKKMFHRDEPLGRQFRMKFWTEHRKFEGKTLNNWAKPGTSSIESMYSVQPVEAELFPENSRVAKKEATCFWLQWGLLKQQWAYS